jgi:hypothetical protein
VARAEISLPGAIAGAIGPSEITVSGSEFGHFAAMQIFGNLAASAIACSGVWCREWLYEGPVRSMGFFFRYHVLVRISEIVRP